MSFSLPILPHARHRDLKIALPAAVLLVDFQLAFLTPEARTFLPDAASAMECALGLAKAARCCGVPVLATRHAHLQKPKPGGMGSWWSSFLMDGEPEAELAPMVASTVDGVVRKEFYSAFRDTELLFVLRCQGVRSLLLAGVMTHICVDTTARDAFQLGFDVFVAADGCASKNRELHLCSLQTLSHAAARIASVETLCALLAGGAS